MLINNEALGRLEMRFDGETAYADYHIVERSLFIDYVFAPEVLRGTGASSKLMAAIMDYCAAQQLTPVPICGFAASWIKRHS